MALPIALEPQHENYQAWTPGNGDSLDKGLGQTVDWIVGNIVSVVGLVVGVVVVGLDTVQSCCSYCSCCCWNSLMCTEAIE